MTSNNYSLFRLLIDAFLFCCLPSQQVELSFQTGNEIYVYGEMDDDGFYMGELDGVRGLVPSNFLTEAGPTKGQQQGAQGGRRPPGQGQGPGARGPPPPPREPPPPGHRRNKGNAKTATKEILVRNHR